MENIAKKPSLSRQFRDIVASTKDAYAAPSAQQKQKQARPRSLQRAGPSLVLRELQDLLLALKKRSGTLTRKMLVQRYPQHFRKCYVGDDPNTAGGELKPHWARFHMLQRGRVEVPLGQAMADHLLVFHFCSEGVAHSSGIDYDYVNVLSSDGTFKMSLTGGLQREKPVAHPSACPGDLPGARVPARTSKKAIEKLFCKNTTNFVLHFNGKMEEGGAKCYDFVSTGWPTGTAYDAWDSQAITFSDVDFQAGIRGKIICEGNNIVIGHGKTFWASPEAPATLEHRNVDCTSIQHALRVEFVHLVKKDAKHHNGMLFDEPDVDHMLKKDNFQHRVLKFANIPQERRKHLKKKWSSKREKLARSLYKQHKNQHPEFASRLKVLNDVLSSKAKGKIKVLQKKHGRWKKDKAISKAIMELLAKKKKKNKEKAPHFDERFQEMDEQCQANDVVIAKHDEFEEDMFGGRSSAASGHYDDEDTSMDPGWDLLE